MSTLLRADTPRPGLENLWQQSGKAIPPEEARLIEALKTPMLQAMDVEKPLTNWLDGRKAYKAGDKQQAITAWQDGLTKVDQLQPLPPAKWANNPDAELKLIRQFKHPGMTGVRAYVTNWQVDGLEQYGVLIVPETCDPKTKFPVLLYLHGAAFGVPPYALPWLARIARTGYVIIGPALRGEALFATGSPAKELNYTCGGGIENLDGEVNDALAAVAGTQKLPYATSGKFGVIGHSFGAGVGLLVTARAKDAACMVSYDAWLTNPFRYYWDRMRRGANNWLSWEDFCNQPVAAQLAGLMKRSIVHHADQINCPLLLFTGGAYDGSVFHQSHNDLLARLKKYKKEFAYDMVPGGGHNFVLYYESEAAKYAYAKHMIFLKQHLPPVPPKSIARPPAPPKKP